MGLLVTLQGRLGIQEKTLVFDGGRKKPVELGGAPRRGCFRMSLEPRGVKLQELFSGSSERSAALAYRAESSDGGGRQ
ncbi:hypothetical protein MPNT_20004 [Candidatus Methylacidithermus pantelleriae]|uniref:Uncharacterized protein n=1 Tax=Candidatus Methylacidithermus pantelleriae TaxID=2744239 RepID=A0A8J2FS10_9BACT|nr:hypothetical protein MPNT_20004 [Candidatus Methylacidithermus pantelleriae]